MGRHGALTAEPHEKGNSMKRLFNLKTNASLGRQMVSIYNLGILVFTCALIFFIDYHIKKYAIAEAEDLQKKQATFFASLIDADVLESLHAVSSRAKSLSELKLTDKEIEATLNSLQKTQPKFSWIGYTDSHGIVKAATQGMLVNKDVSTRPWFSQGQTQDTTLDVHDALLLAKMLQEDNDHSPIRFIDVVAPVKDKAGRTVAVMGGHLSISWLNREIDFYSRVNSNDESFQPFVMGRDGVFRFGNRQAYDQLIGLENHWRKKPSSGTAFLNHAQYGEMIVTFAKHETPELLDQMGWVTVVGIPVSTVIAGVTETRLLAAGGVLALALIAWLMMHRLTQWIHRPIEKLIDAIENIGEDRDQIAELDGLPREFEAIRLEVNKLLHSLSEREKTLKEVLDQINTSFTGMTENFPGVLFSLEDCRGHCFDFTYLSNSAKEYFNLSGPVPRMAKDFFAQVLVDNSEANVERIRNQLIQPNPIDFVIQTKGKNGDVRHMRFKGLPRTSPTGALAWDGVAIDVTDLVMAQESAMAAHEAKSKFLATMSHEIRTPLNGILGFAQILREEMTSPQARRDVQKIIDTADTLTRILNDILDFSKIEAGKIDIESKPFTFVGLTNSVGDIFSAEAKQRGIDFSLNLLGKPNSTLLGDPTRLRQIITNLVSNATKFTSHGQVSLSVEVQAPIEGKSAVHIVVKDTGIGMTEEHMRRLFQRFEQSDPSIFRRYGGTGLGLAIVKGLIDAMGGTIDVDSKVGQGTTFTIALELTAVIHPSALQHTPSQVNVRPLKILVVDDVETNREIICRGLKKDGHTFTQAEDGQKAVELAQTEHFDLILMDLDMPVLNGFEASKSIRSNSKNEETFIMALSGFAYQKDIEAIHHAGMNLHIAKPINLKDLRSVMLQQFGSA